MSDVPLSFPAFIATKTTHADGKVGVDRGPSTLQASDLPDGELTVRVQWSGVNYKDALATLADGGVARLPALVPGVDLAGTVVDITGDAAGFSVGQEVMAHGYDIGVARHGGYAQYARIPSRWAMAVPRGLSTRDAMLIGTAGFTAAASVHALESHGLRADTGPILVTGASGGVGSAAVSMMARRGYTVAASTGKADMAQELRDLGATEILSRQDVSAAGRPLEKERWAAVVDCVGGDTLAYALRSLRYGGAVAASGLTGGTALSTTVLPFILRGVVLLGIDSVQLDMTTRREIWFRCAGDLRPHLDPSMVTEVDLQGLDAALTTVRAGDARGRFLVRLAD